MSKNDGGPAFPVGDQSLHPLMIGMSLRDYFAAAALQGMMSNSALMNIKRIKGETVAHFRESNIRMCYETADAMLKEREQ